MLWARVIRGTRSRASVRTRRSSSRRSSASPARPGGAPPDDELDDTFARRAGKGPRRRAAPLVAGHPPLDVLEDALASLVHGQHVAALLGPHETLLRRADQRERSLGGIGR